MANQARDLTHYAGLSLSYFDLLLRNSWYRLTGSSPVFGKLILKIFFNFFYNFTIKGNDDKGGKENAQSFRNA